METVTKPSVVPYVVAIMGLFIVGVVLIALVLHLRPNADPLLIIGAVFGFLITTGTSIAAYLKSQETHNIVNSELEKWKIEFQQLAHARGVIEGTREEQDRVRRIPARESE